LPNLQGRVTVHQGSQFAIGQQGGEAAVTLLTNQMPAHRHTAQANNSLTGTLQKSPVAGTWAPGSADPLYSSTGGTNMSAAAIATVGGSQPHDNMMPYLTLSFCIALQGIYPSRN
jgi:microcystin-dependent protein